MAYFTTPDKQCVELGNSKYFNRPSSPYVFGCYLRKDFQQLIKNFRKYAKGMHYTIKYTCINSIVACDLNDVLSKSLIFMNFNNAYRMLHKDYYDDLGKGLTSYFVLKINNNFYCIILFK